MKAINKILCAAFLGILSSLSFAANSPDISGSYQCNYHDPFSNPTDSTETIVFKQNGEFIRVSEIPKDAVVPYFVGKGIFSKTVPNVFVYQYWQPKSPNSTSVEFFIIKPDGSLDGVFANANKTKSGKETCVKAPQH